MTSEELDSQIDALADTIRQLAERIKEDGPSLQREHETSTRNVLINPLLQALGWDTKDRKKVRTESPIKSVYGSRDMRADYVLMNGDQQVALVEAKKLSEPLAASIQQPLLYCNYEDIQYMILTDGDHWDMYDLQRKGRLEDDKKVFAASVLKENPYTVARKLIILGYPSLVSRKVLTASGAVLPSLGIGASEPKEVPPTVSPVGATSTTPSNTSPVTQLPQVHNPASGVWVSLNALPGATGYPAPKAIKFADGAEKPIASWPDVLVAVAEWLVSKGVLTAVGPVGITTRSHIINTTAEHPSGKFRKPRQLANGLYVETNVASDQLLKHANFLLGRFEQDAKDVQVRTS